MTRVGLKTQSYKFPYLKLQMWDKDILKYDDLIAETVLDLGEFFKKAFRFANEEERKHLTIKVADECVSSNFLLDVVHSPSIGI